MFNMENEENKKRSELYKDVREELERTDDEALKNDTSSYSYRHLNRDASEEKSEGTPLTFNDQEEKHELSEEDQRLLKYRKVSRTKYTILIGVLCFILIVGVSLLLYFFVFRGL